MARAPLLAVIAITLAAPLSAQPQLGDPLVADRSPGPITQDAVTVFSRQSGMRRQALFPALRTRGVGAVMMDVDNRHVICRLAQTMSTLDVIARVTPGGTISTVALVPEALNSFGGLALDEDGSYLVAGTGNQLLRVNGASVTTLSLPINATLVSIDPGTGDYWLAPFAGAAIRVDRRTAAVTSIVTGFQSSLFGLEYHGRADAMVLASQIRPGLLVVDRSARLRSTLSFGGTLFGLAIDPDDGHMLVLENFDLAELSDNGTKLRSNPLNMPNPSAITLYGSRPISGFGVARPGGRYDLRVSYPNAIGRSYAIVLSLAGTGPGIRLPGGRFVGLTPDALFFHTASIGDLPGVTTGLRGVLGAAGGAQATVRIPTAAPPGTRVFATVVLVDPTAPTGIRTGNTWGFTVQ